jgi:hypothetical protein
VRAPVLLVAALATAAGCLLLSCGWQPPPAPAQPVKFSHRLHAGDNKIGCTMCHAYAADGPVAGIPSAARCNGCHKFIDKEKPDIQIVNKAFEDGKPLEWNRVYRVPDHVYFTHERHIAANVKCQECHGEVQTMDTLRQETSLEMGWCVDCHLARGASRDCLTCHK